MLDLAIHNAQVYKQADGACNIGINDGMIVEISSNPLQADTIIDAAGAMVTPPFVSAHMHLCKVHTLSLLGEDALRRYSAPGMGNAAGAIRLASIVKEKYDRSWIAPNVRSALRDAIVHGTSHLRAFVDVDSKARLEGLMAVLDVRSELADLIEVQVVAFPQDGILCDPDAEDYMRQSMAAGADVVGGIPWIELNDADAREHIRRCFDLAVEYDCDVAMLVDDAGDPSLRTTEMLATETIERGWEGRVTACHGRALSVYPEPTLQRLMSLAARAGMSFVTNPHTGPLHLPMFTLREAGLTVALGQDDIEDAYYPYGQGNLLEVAFLASHILHRFTSEDSSVFLDMVIEQARRAIGLDPAAIMVGEPADLVILDGKNPRDVLARHRPPRHVVRRGRVVAHTVTESRFVADTEADR